MNAAPTRGWVAACAAAAVLGLSATGSGAPEIVSRALPVGAPLELELGAGQIHHFPVALQAEEYVYVEVVQQGVDLEVSLLDAAGRELIAVDSPGGAYSTERLGFVAQSAGIFRVTVGAVGALREKRYSIRAERRHATRRDREYAGACLALAAADAGRRDSSPERPPLLYRRAAEEWRRLGEPLQEIICLTYLAQSLRAQGRQEEALRTYQQALDVLAREVAESGPATDERLAQEIDIQLGMGKVYRRLVRSQEAHDRYQRALRLSRELRDSLAEAIALNNLGLVTGIRGEPAESLRYYEQARDAYRKAESPADLAITLTNLGDLYLGLGALSNAEDSYREAVEISRDLPTASKTVSALLGLGLARLRQGDREGAFAMHEKAVRLARESNDNVVTAVALDRQGTLYRELGRFEPARDDYMEALQLFAERNEPSFQSHTMINLGQLYQDRGEPGKALEYAQRALPLIRRAGDWTAETWRLFLSAQAERRLGRLESARDHVEEVLDRQESLRARASIPSLRQALLSGPRREFFELHVDILMDLAEQRGADYETLALASAERSRARLLLELLHQARADIRQDIAPELRGREKEFYVELNELEARRIQALQSEEPGVVASIEREQRAVARRFDTLQAEMVAKSPRYAALARPPPLVVQHVQKELLDSTTTILFFFLGEEESYLWRLTQKEVQAYVLSPRAEIEEAATDYYRLLKESFQARLQKALYPVAEKLSRMLLEDVYAELGDQRLVIVADGALHYVPFAALTTPAGRFLVEDHEIVALPSLSALDVLRRGPATSPADWKVAALADPVFEASDERLRSVVPDGSLLADDDQFHRLPYSRSEAEAILSLVPPGRGFQALGFEASRETVLGGALSGYDVVHFATHGVLNADLPQLSGIVLSLVDETGRPRDGFLRLHDIYDLDLPVELVVLSACRTALGKEVGGEGLVGLTRGFMYAGASRAVVSLWRVSDQRTAELMQRFYRAMLKDGQLPAAALRSAQRSMIAEPRYAAPYYWAPFVLHGDWP